MRLFVSNKEWSFQSLASEDSFIIFVDDHNIANLDGKRTFYGMGIVAAITNKGNFIAKQSMRLRHKSYTKVIELVRKKGITSYDFRPNVAQIIYSNHVRISCHFLPILYPLVWTVFGMLQGYLAQHQSRGQTGMVSCRMSLKESILTV